MDIGRVDLNLLKVFAALLQHQNVTRAGHALGLSQPAMSAALTRLRELFDEPLFVRGGGGMKPTPRAQQLAEPVTRVLELVRNEVMQPARFDPKTTDRTFVISTADIGEMVIVPQLLQQLAVDAPQATLRCVGMSRDVHERLQDGSVDLAIGYFPELTGANMFQQRLYKYDFVCIARADHPTIGDTITLRQFLATEHAVLRAEGRNRGVVEQFLQKKGLKRRAAVYVSQFTSLPAIVAKSNLIATVPRSVALTFSRNNVRTIPLPFKTPVNQVKQHWHRRFHADPANLWLRQLVARRLADK